MSHFASKITVARFVTAASALAFATLAPVGATHAADKALLIGVNHYAGLSPGHDLGGCVNDAQMMADCLQKYGFSTTVLTEGAATKAGILQAIATLKSQVKPSDRIVVYFAGHGTVSQTGQTSILPSDADDATDKNDLRTDELYAAVRALPSQSKTILLDSCHSGGMVRSLDNLRGGTKNKLVPRVYVRTVKTRGGDAKAWQRTNVNGADNLSDTTKGGGVAYFTAALKTQVANELEIEGKRHGLFTYFLSKVLTGSLASGGLKNGVKVSWGNVVSKVTEKVAEIAQGEQKPLLGPGAFLKQAVFAAVAPPSANGDSGASPAPAVTPAENQTPPTAVPTGEATVTPPPPPAETNPPAPQAETPAAPPAPPAPAAVPLDTLYNLSAPDPARIVLEMLPGTSPVTVGDTVRFRITASMDGYVLLIGKDPTGKLSVLYPESTNVSAAQVKSGTVINIPQASGEAFTPDAPGTDGLKAILFTSKTAAEALLKSFGGGALDIEQANREWKKKTVAPSDFYTSEIITQIVGKTTAATTGGDAPKAN